MCCGFGGTFCVKYPDISNAIVEKKTQRIAETGAETLLAGDLGCLLNMAGKLKREGRATKIPPRGGGAGRHEQIEPAIGEGRRMKAMLLAPLRALLAVRRSLRYPVGDTARRAGCSALYDKCFSRDL